MPNDTVTFALGGQVTFDAFRDGIRRFHSLVTALAKEIGVSRDVSWFIADLQISSATTTIRGESRDPTKVERLVHAYGTVGAALECQQVIGYGTRVVRAAHNIGDLIIGTIEYVRFETPQSDFTIFRNGEIPSQSPIVHSIGAVEGRIQTLTSRGGLRFNLYDTIHDRAVACYLQEGQEEMMREAWGRRARVSGNLSRERETGRPLAIRQILNIDIIPEIQPGSYRSARGALPWQLGDAMPEDVIRQLRDA